MNSFNQNHCVVILLIIITLLHQTNVRSNADDSCNKLQNDLKKATTCLESYWADYNKYPVSMKVAIDALKKDIPDSPAANYDNDVKFNYKVVGNSYDMKIENSKCNLIYYIENGKAQEIKSLPKSLGINKQNNAQPENNLCDTDAIIKKYEKRLRNIAGKDLNHLKKNLQVSSCFEFKDNELFLSGCAPHSCTFEESIIAIDLSINKISAAILTNKKIKYFSEDKNNIPSSIKSWKNKMD